MTRIVHVAWADKVLHQYGKRVLLLNQNFPKVLPRIVNQVGGRAKTQVVRNLTKQTGLPRKTIVKAVGDPSRATPGRLSYEMITRGGNIRLKYLDPKETPEGVIAKAFGKATLYPGAFMRAGQWPNRVDMTYSRSNVKTKNLTRGWDGHAFYRLNRSGTRITYARSGVIIPVEMTSGATKAAFDRIAGPLLQERVGKALARLIP